MNVYGPPRPANTSPEVLDFINQCLQRDRLSRPTATELLSHPFLAAPQQQAGRVLTLPRALLPDSLVPAHNEGAQASSRAAATAAVVSAVTANISNLAITAPHPSQSPIAAQQLQHTQQSVARSGEGSHGDGSGRAAAEDQEDEFNWDALFAPTTPAGGGKIVSPAAQ